MTKLIKAKFGAGKFTSVYAASTQGLHGVLITMFCLLPIAIQLSNTSGNLLSVIISTIVETIMFSFSLVVYLINSVIGKGQMNYIKFLFSKKGLIVFLSGVVGGGMGTTMLTLAIKYAGENYGVVLSATFPVISAIFSHWLFKEKIKKLGIVGLVGVVLSTILLTVIGAEANSNPTNIFIGVFLGFLAGFFWAAEALIVSFFFRKNDQEIDDNLTILVRETGSAVSLLVMIAPIFSLFFTSEASNAYIFIGKIFTNWKGALSIVGLGANLYLSWLTFFNAIRHMGATDATTINVSYVVWTPLFGMLLFPLTIIGFSVPNWSYWVFSICLVISIVLVIKNVQKPKQ